MVAEGAFGQLKGRYRVLNKKCESSKSTVKKMALASMVLHNVCINQNDTVPRNFDITIDEISNKRRPQDQLRDMLDMISVNQRILGYDTEAAKNVRDAIRNVFWKEKQNYELQYLSDC